MVREQTVTFTGCEKVIALALCYTGRDDDVSACCLLKDNSIKCKIIFLYCYEKTDHLKSDFQNSKILC